ncbi:MAG: hypothetical protein LUI12_10115 [Clostridiales bacterium]|nr:hypothetical protein [Clostridiales bacterium]
MDKKLSPWSKEVKKAMLDRDMDTNDVAAALHYTRQYVSTVINGGRYYRDAVVRISQMFDIEVPEEGTTLAKTKQSCRSHNDGSKTKNRGCLYG